MESDEPGRRPGGPRRAPVNRPARRQPAPRRTSGRTGAGPRRPRPASGTPRGGRPGPAPAPRPVPHTDPNPAPPGHADSGYAEPGYADPGYADPGYAGPGYADPGYADSGYAGPGYADSGYADSGYAEPGYADSGYAGPGYADPGYADPGHAGPGYADSGYADDDYQDAAYQEQPPAAAPRRGGRPQARAGKNKKAKGGAKNAKAPTNAQRPTNAKGPKNARGPKAAKVGMGAKAGKARRPSGAVPGAASGVSGAPGPDGRPPRVPSALLHTVAALGPKAYFVAAGALAAVVLLGFGALAVTGGADGDDARSAALPPVGTAAETGPSPTSYSNSPSSDAYAGIKTRKADAKPLTVEEAFPKGARTLSVPETEVELKLAAEKLDGDCAAAVWGASVAADLRRGGCSQAARGLYADTDAGYGMAVAVFNLASAADADRFVATLGEVRGGGFVRPLPADASTEFGAGFSMARGLAQGHFAVVSWSARLDGSGGASDEALLSMLIEGGKAPAVLARAAAAAE